MAESDYQPPVASRPPSHLTRLQYRLFRAYIETAIDGFDDEPELRDRLLELLYAGSLKIASLWSVINVNDREVPDLTYRVSIPVETGEYAPLCDIHWTLLRMTVEQLDEELKLSCHLNGNWHP